MNTPRPPDSLGVPGTGRTASAAPEPHRPPAGATRPGRPAPTTGELGRTGLVAMLLCTALPLVDTYVVNVALAEIGRDLHTGPALLELVVAGYSIAHAVGLVPGGRLGDAHGRRTLLLAGLTAFGLSSLACGLAPTAGTLVVARVVQGMTAALMLPQVLATLQATTTGARRGRAISLYAGIGGLALITGQILGGLILTADPGGTGWRAIFLVNVPAVLAALYLVRRHVPHTRSATPTPVDVPGTALLAAALAALLLPLTEGRAAGWPLWSWLSLAACPLLLGLFWRAEHRVERRGQVPLVPPKLLGLPGFRRALPLLALSVAGFSGLLFSLALAFQDGLRYTPLVSGLTIVPYAATFFTATLTAPRLTSRYGSRVVTVGSLLLTAGLAVVVGIVLTSWESLHPVALLPGLAVGGFGQGLVNSVLSRLVLAEVPTNQAGVAGGVMTTAVQAAMALGVALLGTLYLTLVPRTGADVALATTLTAQLAAVLLTAGCSLRLPRRTD